MNILSIQSHVAYGHVGNAAACFPIQRLGHEVWPIHTVQFSNHTGYGAWRGEVFPASLIDACVEGIAERGVLGRCDAVLSGYLGSLDTGEAILRAVRRVRAANPAAVWCCDPVIGDVGRGVFVRPGIADFFRDVAIPAADIVTPNHFELDLLTGTAARTASDVRGALARLHVAGPGVILVTSLVTDETPVDSLDLVVSEGESAWRLRTPKLPLSVNGAGDAIAALFLVHLRGGAAPPAAMASAASSVHGLLAATARRGARELALIEAQDEIVAPSRLFRPEPLNG